MLHSEFQRQGFAPDNVIGLADNETIEYMLRVSGFIWKKFKAIDSMTNDEWSHISAVRLKMGIDGVLECLDRLTGNSNLVYLEIPVSTLNKALHKVGNLHSLRYLDISGEGFGSIQHCSLHQIQSLEAVDAKLKVDAASLPQLQHLHICDKPKGMIAKLIREMPHLNSLTLSPYSNKLTQELDLQSLLYARLINGEDESISAIKIFPSLTNVHIQNMGRLTSIEPLLDNPNLRELSICYCNRVRDIEQLCELPSLEKLHIYACKFDCSGIARRLAGKLLELRIN